MRPLAPYVNSPGTPRVSASPAGHRTGPPRRAVATAAPPVAASAPGPRLDRRHPPRLRRIQPTEHDLSDRRARSVSFHTQRGADVMRGDQGCQIAETPGQTLLRPSNPALRVHRDPGKLPDRGIRCPACYTSPDACNWAAGPLSGVPGTTGREPEATLCQSTFATGYRRDSPPPWVPIPSTRHRDGLTAQSDHHARASGECRVAIRFAARAEATTGEGMGR